MKFHPIYFIYLSASMLFIGFIGNYHLGWPFIESLKFAILSFVFMFCAMILQRCGKDAAIQSSASVSDEAKK